MSRKKTRIAKGLGAGALAVATLASGLSFGSAAIAAPKVEPVPIVVHTEAVPIAATLNDKSFYPMDTAYDSVAMFFRSYEYAGTALDAGPQSFVRYFDDRSFSIEIKGRCQHASTASFVTLQRTGCGLTTDRNKRWTLTDGGELRSVAYPDARFRGSATSGAGWNPMNTSGTGPEVRYFGLNPEYAGAQPLSALVESTDAAGRSAVISGRAKPGSTILVGGSGVGVGADGTWKYTATGLSLGKNTLHIEQWEAGAKVDEIDLEVMLDVQALTATASFGDTLTQRATVSGSAAPRADIEVRDLDGVKVAGGVADGSGDYSVPLEAPNTAGNYHLTVAQKDGADVIGDPVNLTVAYGSGVTITSPMNGAEHDGGKLTVTGVGQAGATVSVREKGGSEFLATGTVSSTSNLYTLEIPELDSAGHTLEVRQTSKGNNLTTAEVTVDPGQDTVDLTAAGKFDTTDATKPAIAHGDAPTGSTVILRNSVGQEIGRTLAKDDAYEIVIDPAKATAGVNTFSVLIEGTPASEAKSFTLDYGQTAAPVVVTKPVKNGTVASGPVEFAGFGQAGANIVVRGSSRVVATATANGQGAWAGTSTALSDGKYDLYFDQISKGGLKSTIRHAFTVGQTAPIVTPHTVTSPAAGGVVDTLTPEFRGAGHEGADIVVRGSSRVIATGKVVNGQWVAKTNADAPLAPGAYSLYVDQVIRGTVVGTIRASFTVSNNAFRELTLTAPTQNENVTTVRPMFVGTATPGATIRVGSSRTTVATTTVGADGRWTATADFDLARGGTYTGLEVKQTTTGGKTSTVSSSFTVDRNAQ